ncbi:MAG: STAS domain-containing protein [Armatimonadota bacterium]
MGSTTGMQIAARRLDPLRVVIDISGEMDAFTSPRAKQMMAALIEEGCRHLIVNLRGLHFIDSSGLGALLGTLRRAREQGGTLRLVAPPSHVRRIFEITRLTYSFPIDASEADAELEIAREAPEARAA